MTVHQVNLLNIALMLVSTAVAFTVPFGLFLFAYAVLGPLLYLTQISCLHSRGCFTDGRRDYLALFAMVAVPLALEYVALDRYGLVEVLPRAAAIGLVSSAAMAFSIRTAARIAMPKPRAGALGVHGPR